MEIKELIDALAKFDEMEAEDGMNTMHECDCENCNCDKKEEKAEEVKEETEEK